MEPTGARGPSQGHSAFGTSIATPSRDEGGNTIVYLFNPQSGKFGRREYPSEHHLITLRPTSGTIRRPWEEHLITLLGGLIHRSMPPVELLTAVGGLLYGVSGFCYFIRPTVQAHFRKGS